VTPAGVGGLTLKNKLALGMSLHNFIPKTVKKKF